MWRMRRRTRIIALAVVLVAALTGVVWRGVARESGARVVTGTSAASGWKTIAYRGVRVEIPTGWQRSDRDDCEFEFERWAEPAETGCATEGEGVSFYGSATFDPAYGPGLRRGDAVLDGAAWAGYTETGDYAVYTSGADRELVADILDSVHPVG